MNSLRQSVRDRLQAYPALWHDWQAQRAAIDPQVWAIRTPTAMTQILALRWGRCGAAELLTVRELLTVAGAVSALPPVAQDVVRWREWEHLPAQVVADRLYLSRTGLYRVHQRACDQLAHWWQARPPRVKAKAVEQVVWF